MKSHLLLFKERCTEQPKPGGVCAANTKGINNFTKENSMTDVYSFHVALQEFESKFWRDFQISSNATVAFLAYTVLGSYQAQGEHLFCVDCKGVHYEFPIDDFDDELPPSVDPSAVKLRQLKLAPGDTLTVVYDYGDEWTFQLEYQGKAPMERNTWPRYPLITDGAGQGIIEDIGRDGLEEIVQNKDEKGEDYIISEFQGIPMYWDYTRFDLASENLVLKEKARYLRALYEIPFEDDFEPDFSE